MGARLRRLLATLVMVAGGLPAALEFSGHAPDAEGSLHHVEASSVRHHGDHCLAVWVASEKVAPMAAPPALATLADPAVDAPAPVAEHPDLPQFHRPASRAPPVQV